MDLKQSIIQKDAELFLNKNNDSNSSNETRIGLYICLLMMI